MKVHLDRLSRRGYAPGTVRNDKYRVLVRKIMAENTRMINNRVADVTDKNWKKVAKTVGTKTKQLTIPTIDEVLPGRSVQALKAAQQGDLISDTLRDAITAKLRASVFEYTEKPTARVDKDLVKSFEKSIRSVFRGYTKKDPKIGIPKNIHTIAVTETRTAINNIKNSYVTKLQSKNPEFVIKKRWVHNPSLSHEGRPGHISMNGKTIPMNDKFLVKTYVKKGDRWIQSGSVKMAHPHDTSAPPGETIGCNCDIVYTTVKKR